MTDARAPLSFAQERLWFLEQLEPGIAANHLHAVTHVRGDFSVGAFVRAVHAVAERHDSLRTTVEVDPDGTPYQRVGGAPVEVVRTDLSTLDPEAARIETRRLARHDAERPFDLRREPPLRVRVFTLPARKHVVLLVVHRIAADGPSIEILGEELTRHYRQLVEGAPASRPAPAMRYAQFAARQRERFETGGFDEDLTYWRRTLAGAQTTELPLARPRPSSRSSAAALERVPVAPPARERLEALAREREATLFMALLAVFQVALARYTWQDDLTVGIPVEGRVAPATTSIVGPFANTLAIRCDLRGDPTLAEVVERTRDRARAALAYQEVPFELVVADLDPPRDPSTHPIFQVLFGVESDAGALLEVADATERIDVGIAAHARFDLEVTFLDEGSQLTCQVVARTDVFARDFARGFAEEIVRLVETLSSSPHRPLSTIELSTGRADPVPEQPERTATLARLFEAQVDRAPHAVALAASAADVTYDELDRRANRLARYLRRHGVRRQVPVVIRLPRTEERLVALLAVLKSGGTAVPVDPEHPRARVGAIADDVRAGLVVTTADVGAKAPFERVPVLVLEAIAREVASESEERLAGAAGPDPAGTAYVVYTSGSSGRPKGVRVSHGAAASCIAGHHGRVPIGPGTRLLQLASPAFDAFLGEVFLALTMGAALVLPTEAEAATPEGIAQAIVRTGATAVIATPSLLRRLDPAEVPGLRAILAGAERCPVELLELWGDREWFSNGYGPTECAITSLFWAARGSPRRVEEVPIGRPLPNTVVRVLDRYGNLAPHDAVGELSIGGHGLADGYHGQPALTAARFVPDAFGAPRTRVYATGDLVRRAADGNLVFVRRTDDQLKIRGHRIEPAEVDAALEAHEDVREAAVALAPAPSAGDELLVASLVAEGGRRLPDPGELRAFLAASLPAYMLPSSFVEVDALPRGPGGKVLRAELRHLPGRVLGGGVPEPPRTELESLVAEHWCEVLGLAEVFRGDDFFSLGGHSLLAARVTVRLRTSFGIDFPVRLLFDAPTLASFAEAVGDEIIGSMSSETLATALSEVAGETVHD